MATFEHEHAQARVDDDGVAVITLASPGGVNKVEHGLLTGLAAALDWLAAREHAGVLLTSGHREFCVGADLDMVMNTTDPAAMRAAVDAMHAVLRRLETGRPVAVVLAGSALGGGYELALACHHRVAVDHPRVQIGLPEVNLGVIPGGGGTQRLARLVGLQAAADLILQGKLLRAPKALPAGLVHALAPDADAALQAARAWVLANPKARQPWDARSFRWPGVRPGSPDARNLFLGAAAMVYKKTAGAFPAPEQALAVLQEGAAVTFERSLEIEARAFVSLATSARAHAMIRTLFFHKTAADKQRGLPQVDDSGFRRVAVLGAGMMGAGIAFLCAKAGLQVVLRDIRDDAIEAGLAHVQLQCDKLRHLDADARAAIRERVTGTTELEPLRGVDLVIEAVFEDLALKHRVIAEVEPLLADGAVFASNTSALPITQLATASAHPDRFIGLHYFSPVEKMPLLEIVRGAATSDDTLARCLHFARQTKKTPIVVNDGYGFYTTRVFSAYILEGAQLVAEGHDPVVVDWAARAAGMVVGPLQVFDEVTLTLGVHAMAEAERYLGVASIPGAELVKRMVDAGRLGKAHGAGFYDYSGGKRRGVWDELHSVVDAPRQQASVEELGERLILAQLAEVGRVLDDGVLRTWRDAEVGAIFGIGFAPNTGGPLSAMDERGLPELVAELRRRAELHGERYAPSPLLVGMAERGERFFG